LPKSVETLGKIRLFFCPQMSGFAVGKVTNPGSIPALASIIKVRTIVGRYKWRTNHEWRPPLDDVAKGADLDDYRRLLEGSHGPSESARAR